MTAKTFMNCAASCTDEEICDAFEASSSITDEFQVHCDFFSSNGTGFLLADLNQTQKGVAAFKEGLFGQ